MQTCGIICLVLLIGLVPVYAQEAGPQVPTQQGALTKYCSTGICSTGTIPVLTGINDTGQEIKSRYNIIMIIPSELCTVAIKNHVKTDCPSLESLMKYDTSNQNISGKFIDQKGIITRTNPQVKNHWQYYGYTNHTVVCVYCTGNYLTTDLYKTIILEPVSFEYAPKNFVTETINIPQFNSSSGDFTNVQYAQNEIDSGLTTFSNRQVVGCNTATIAYSDYLLNDTIKYLESDCKVSHVNMTKTYSTPNSPWNYNNPYSTLHYLNDIKSMMKGHSVFPSNNTPGGFGPSDCIHYKCNITTSTKKVGW